MNCETDFVAKNGDFVGVAQTLLDLALNEGVASKEDLLTKTFPGTSLTVADKITEEVGKIGERIEIGDMRVVNGDKVVGRTNLKDCDTKQIMHLKFLIYPKF